MNKIIKFKRINFFNCNFDYIIKYLINKKGYLVAPAASALSIIDINKKYHDSLIGSKVAIFDSGYFCILLKFFKKISVNKFSGYLFIKKLFNSNYFKNQKIFLINPDYRSSKIYRSFLLNKKFFKNKSYVAPIYKNYFNDLILFSEIKKYNPNIILINISGIKQEQLAMNIEKKLKKKYIIICTGAAIGFHTNTDAKINDFIDKVYLGWFMRVLHKPNVFIKRTVLSTRLFKLFF
jgi:N-acetylglucosaminyldiphosphoundecaprenol N-acetyl-beta-D-mannosaminyltransferase